MADELFKTIATDFFIGLFIGLLAIGVVAHANSSTLDGAAYAQALHISVGQPATHAEQLTGIAFSIVSPLLGWHADSAKNLISFFLLFPLGRLLASAVLAFGALRLWKFGRLEAGLGAALLPLAAPIAMAFYPGLMPPEAIAIPCALLGLFGLAWAAHEKGHAPAGFVLAIIGFTLSVWVSPWMMALPLSIFIGQIALNHQDLPTLLSTKWDKQVFFVVLLLPLAALAGGPLPTFSASADGFLRFLHLGQFAIGLAAAALAALLARKQHPQALFFAFAALAGLIFATVSPAAAMLAMLLPIAYGWRTLRHMEHVSLLAKIAMLGAVVLFVSIGLLGNGTNLEATLGFAALAILGAVALVHLYNWSPGLASGGLAVLLISGSVMSGVQAVPGTQASSPYYYEPLSNSTQIALLWIGENHAAGQTPHVAVLASGEAVQELAGGSMAANNQTLLRWLAGGANATSPLRPGDYVIASPDLFAQMKANQWQLGRDWSLVAFSYDGNFTDTQRGQTYATYVSDQKIGLYQPLDAEGKMTSGKPLAFSLLTGAGIGSLSASDIALLRPEQPVGAPGNLLLWLNREYGDNILRLFRNDAGFRSVYVNGSTEVLQVVGG